MNTNSNKYICILLTVIICIIAIYYIRKLYYHYRGNIGNKANIGNRANIEKFETTATFLDKKIPIWTYWENKPGHTMPAHISLCLKTFKMCSDRYVVHILNEMTIYDYLPNLRKDMDKLLLAQKSDYIRIALLYEYGGLWVDADTIIMSNLEEISEKLDDKWDFIGFGCTGQICFSGYPNPSNGVMASQKNGILVGKCLRELNKILDSNKKDNYSYFELGKIIIWGQLEKLMKRGYDYFHFPSEYDGSRDINGNWVNSENHLDTKATELINEDKALFIFLANNELSNFEKYKWICDKTEDEILGGNWWLSYLFRKSLGL